jgi:hypothetical protein
MIGLDILTHSRIDAFQRCRRYHYNAYVLGVRPPPTEPMRFGGVMHRCVEQWHQNIADTDILNWLTEHYGDLLRRVDDSTLRDILNYESMKVIHLFEGWIARWWESRNNIVQAEITFEIPILNPDTGQPTPTYRHAGKIDAIIKLEDGRLAVYELKTVGDAIGLGSDYWQSLQLDTQITRYMLAARKLGYDVSTVLYDVIRKPEISPCQIPVFDENGFKIVVGADDVRIYLKPGIPRQSADKTQGWKLKTRTETPVEYGTRLRDDIAKRPEFYYARMEVPRLEHELDECSAELWDIQRDIRAAELNNRHYLNPRSCRWPYRCPYLSCCVNRTDLTREVPEGFVRVETLHPELENQNGSSTGNDPAEGDAAPASSPCAAEEAGPGRSHPIAESV